MTHKQDKKSHTFTNFLGELSCIFGDVFFMYRNFFHWNISKILITIWSFVLASIIALPVLFLAIVIGFIDPINWNIFIESELLGTDPTLEMIANISTHPFWLGGVVFFIVLSAFLFFSSLSYGLFLMLRISLKYTQRKKLALRKNLYFSKKHMYSFYILLGKTMFVVISPLFIWTLLAIIGYVLLNLGVLSGEIVSSILFLLSIFAIAMVLYFFYKRIWGILIFAQQKKGDDIHKANHYMKKSLQLTPWKLFPKALIVILLYLIITFPFRVYEASLSQNIERMKITLQYRSENVNPEQRSYYKYISQDYKDLDDQSLVRTIIETNNKLKIYRMFFYLIFGGLGIMMLSSFYMRVVVRR